MTDQTLHITVVRPYRTTEELLAAELWAISDRTMILVGAPPQIEGTSVRFDLALSDGQVLVRAEGTVIKYYAGHGNRPAGLAIRVNVLDEGGRMLIGRANAMRGQSVPPDGLAWSQTPSPPSTGGSASKGVEPVPPTDGWPTPRSAPLARSASVVPAARRVPSSRSPVTDPMGVASAAAPSSARTSVPATTEPRPPDSRSTTPTSSPPTRRSSIPGPATVPLASTGKTDAAPAEAGPPPPASARHNPPPASERSVGGPNPPSRTPAEIGRLAALQRLRERRK